MARTVKNKVGPLSLQDKVFIAENFLLHDNEWIAKKLKRSITYVNNYVDKLNHKSLSDNIEKEKREELSTKIKNSYVENKKNSTVMTQQASSIPIKINKYESPFKTR